MVDIVTILAAAAGGGGVAHIANAAVGFIKSKQDRDQARESVGADLDKHRDKLTFELLEAARAEVVIARNEAAEMRVLQARLIHYEEALDHIKALLEAVEPSDRIAAERRASQFLTRMRRLADATGTARNEVQIEISKTNLLEGDGHVEP